MILSNADRSPLPALTISFLILVTPPTLVATAVEMYRALKMGSEGGKGNHRGYNDVMVQ